MTRIALLSLALAACSDASGSKLDAQPTRNLVCERVALLSPKAACVAEMSGVEPLNIASIAARSR